MMAVMTTDQAPQQAARGPRERMVRSAVALFCVRGVSGTGLREIVEHAQAPRGSLQHYFPGGKEQLVAEALALAGHAAGRRVARLQDADGPQTPSAVFAAMVTVWRRALVASNYARGCPVVAAASDTAAASDVLREAADAAFRAWQAPIETALVKAGVPAERTAALALLMLSALEGAIVLARTRQDPTPLDAVLAELAPLLDGAVSGADRQPGRTAT